MRFGVAKEGAASAAEAEVRHRRRHADVDADHAHRDIVLKIARRLAARSENRGGVAERMAFDDARGFFERVNFADADDRTKNLFAGDNHRRLDVSKHRWSDEIAVFFFANLAAIQQKFRAFIDALLNITEHAFFMFRRNHRTHRHRWIKAVADMNLFRDFHHTFAQHVVRFANRENNAASETALTGATEAGFHCGGNGFFHVRIRHDDEKVFRAAECLHALAVFRAGFINILGHRRGANERDAFDVGMAKNRVDGFFLAVDHVDHAGRKLALFQQFKHALHAERYLFRGFEQEGIAGRHRKGQKPQRHHQRKIERRDRRKHAERPAHRHHVDARAGVFQRFALHQRRNADRDFNAFNAAAQTAARFVDSFAMLGGDALRQFFKMFFE